MASASWCGSCSSSKGQKLVDSGSGEFVDTGDMSATLIVPYGWLVIEPGIISRNQFTSYQNLAIQ